MGKKEQLNCVVELTTGEPPRSQWHGALNLTTSIHTWQGPAHIQSAWPEGQYPSRATSGEEAELAGGHLFKQRSHHSFTDRTELINVS